MSEERLCRDERVNPPGACLLGEAERLIKVQ
jgi:hypothetical protein